MKQLQLNYLHLSGGLKVLEDCNINDSELPQGETEGLDLLLMVMDNASDFEHDIKEGLKWQS